jgi:hemolysin activation/secretion protein
MRLSSPVLPALSVVHFVAFMTFHQHLRPESAVAVAARGRGGGRLACWRRLLVAAFPLLCTVAAAQEPQPPFPSLAELEAAGAVIGDIRIVVNNVFDTSDPREDKSLFRGANALHVTTRPGVIERRLLFKRGERLNVHTIEESERVLRGVRYLYDVRIRPVAFRDGVVDLEVATRDTWTLYPSISASRSGGANKAEVSINEVNLLGTGSSVSFGYFKDVDRSGRSLDFSNDNIFGRWTALQFSIARNSDGSKDALSLVRPFYELDARWTAGIKAVSDDRLEPVYTAGEQTSEYRARERSAEAFGGWSRGLIDGWVHRYTVGMSFDDNSYRLEPGRVPPANLPPDEKLVGPYFRYQVVEDRYLKTENRNQMGRPEYFAIGLNSTLQLGWASTDLGSSYDALLYEGTISRGFELLDDHTLLAAASIEGQFTDGEVRRQQFGASAQYFLPHYRRWVFYASMAGDVLTNPDPSDVLYLGGDNGLRGYPLRYQSGTQRALLTLEQRLYTGAFPWRLFRIGAAAYVDVGRAWGGSNTNTTNPGWLTDVGIGLRFFSVRTGFGNVLHLDLAFPVNPTPDVDSVQLLVRGRATF